MMDFANGETMRASIAPIRASTMQSHLGLTWRIPGRKRAGRIALAEMGTQGHGEAHVVASRQKTGTGLAFLTGATAVPRSA